MLNEQPNHQFAHQFAPPQNFEFEAPTFLSDELNVIYLYTYKKYLYCWQFRFEEDDEKKFILIKKRQF